MENLARSRFFKSEDNFRSGCFSTTAFACQGEDFGWLDIKADIIHRCKTEPGNHIALRVPFGQFVYFEQLIHVVLLQPTSRQLYGLQRFDKNSAFAGGIYP